MLKNPDYQAQREGIRAIEKESDESKRAGLDNLDIERLERIEAKKQEIRNKFTMGAEDEAEMRNELMNLMERGSGTYENVLNQAEMEKKAQDDALAEKLRRRK